MRVDLFDFDLPESSIALRPAEPRDAARMLVVRPEVGLEDRIVRDLPDLLQPGDVLVCPITSPAWSVLFPNVKALVADAGSVLSHSAIIAREFAIPAVVATGNATSVIRDGQLVTVDGTTGSVEVLA